MTEGNFINGSTIMIRRECFDRAGLFDESMKYVADGEMWFRMLQYTAFGHLPEILVKYRWHPANQSHNVPAMRYYIRLAFARLLDMCPPEDLVPGTPHPPRRGDRARAHAVVARALEDRWNQASLAATHYARSFLWRPSAAAAAGWLRTQLYRPTRVWAVATAGWLARNSTAGRARGPASCAGRFGAPLRVVVDFASIGTASWDTNTDRVREDALLPIGSGSNCGPSPAWEVAAR